MSASLVGSSTDTPATLSAVELSGLDARNWGASKNYLSVGQLYLDDNPLLKRPLELSDVKPLVVGHWGTTPGQNFIYVHLNRVISKYELENVERRRSGAWRSCACGQYVPGGQLQRGVSGR